MVHLQEAAAPQADGAGRALADSTGSMNDSFDRLEMLANEDPFGEPRILSPVRESGETLTPRLPEQAAANGANLGDRPLSPMERTWTAVADSGAEPAAEVVEVEEEEQAAEEEKVDEEPEDGDNGDLERFDSARNAEPTAVVYTAVQAARAEAAGWSPTAGWGPTATESLPEKVDEYADDDFEEELEEAFQPAGPSAAGRSEHSESPLGSDSAEEAMMVVRAELAGEELQQVQQQQQQQQAEELQHLQWQLEEEEELRRQAVEAAGLAAADAASAAAGAAAVGAGLEPDEDVKSLAAAYFLQLGTDHMPMDAVGQAVQLLWGVQLEAGDLEELVDGGSGTDASGRRTFDIDDFLHMVDDFSGSFGEPAFDAALVRPQLVLPARWMQPAVRSAPLCLKDRPAVTGRPRRPHRKRTRSGRTLRRPGMRGMRKMRRRRRRKRAAGRRHQVALQRPAALAVAGCSIAMGLPPPIAVTGCSATGFGLTATESLPEVVEVGSVVTVTAPGSPCELPSPQAPASSCKPLPRPCQDLAGPFSSPTALASADHLFYFFCCSCCPAGPFSSPTALASADLFFYFFCCGSCCPAGPKLGQRLLPDVGKVGRVQAVGKKAVTVLFEGDGDEDPTPRKIRHEQLAAGRAVD